MHQLHIDRAASYHSGGTRINKSRNDVGKEIGGYPASRVTELLTAGS
jgi:hypothetical protein